VTPPDSRPTTGWMDAAACSGHIDLGWLKEPEDVPFGEELAETVREYSPRPAGEPADRLHLVGRG
jgi:hypothetical protein